MTTIAWDGSMVVADSMGVAGTYRNPEPRIKVIMESGIVFAASGCSGLLEPFMKWYLEDEADPRNTPPLAESIQYTFLVFKPLDRPLCYNQGSPYPYWPGAPDAWGSGCEYAIGAMLWGASAVQAVGIACKANPSNTAPPLRGYRIAHSLWVPLTDAECAL